MRDTRCPVSADVKTKGTRNYGDYGSPALDVKLDKQSTMYDLPARQQLVYEIQRDLLNAPGPVWMGSRSVFSVWSTKLRNVQQYSFASAFWEAENVWIKA